MKEYGWRTSRPAKSNAETPVERKLTEVLRECFRIYFPARETVAESKGGLGVSVFGVSGQTKRHFLNIQPIWNQFRPANESQGAGTICFQPKWWGMDTFPKHLMRDCRSQRSGMLMHSKMIFVRPRAVGRHGARAWAYVGSANLSESAW